MQHPKRTSTSACLPTRTHTHTHMRARNNNDEDNNNTHVRTHANSQGQGRAWYSTAKLCKQKQPHVLIEPRKPLRASTASVSPCGGSTLKIHTVVPVCLLYLYCARTGSRGTDALECKFFWGNHNATLRTLYGLYSLLVVEGQGAHPHTAVC